MRTIGKMLLLAFVMAAGSDLARSETVDLYVRGYCTSTPSFCGHGSYKAYRKHILEAVQELNLEWEYIGISFCPWLHRGRPQ